MPFYHTIVCVDKNYGIAKNELNRSYIPWHFKDEYIDIKKQDLLFFKKITTGHTIIMGRKTFEEIGILPYRENIIISSTLKLEDAENKNVLIFSNPYDVIKFLNKRKYEHIFVIGGEKIYNWFIKNNLITLEFISIINNDFNCNLFYNKQLEYKIQNNNRKNLYKKYSLNEFKNNKITDNETKQFNQNDQTNYIINKLDNILYEYKLSNLTNLTLKNIDEKCWLEIYKNCNDEENDILNVFKFVLSSNEKTDRTGVGTLSSFGHNLYFSLMDNSFPLMTTRNIWLKGLFEEFMLYLRGQTNSKILEAKGVNVWKGNTTREFLDKRGLQHLPEGDMGSSYGFLFRHFGAKYIDCNTDYIGQGFDQLEWLINEIKTNPDSRRLIINLWDPSQINNMSLPPCLYQYQFYVNKNSISCMATQRSSDIMTALGWNIAQISLFTILLGAVCNLKPKYIIWNGADVHIYNNLIDQAKQQIKREPYLFPKLYIKNIKKNITEYEYEDLELVNYTPQSKIDVIMNV